jgi:hypothetical protein
MSRFVEVSVGRTNKWLLPVGSIGRIAWSTDQKVRSAPMVYDQGGASIGNISDSELDSLRQQEQVFSSPPGWYVVDRIKCTTGFELYRTPVVGWSVKGPDTVPVTPNSIMNRDILNDGVALLLHAPDGQYITCEGIVTIFADDDEVLAWIEHFMGSTESNA